MSDLLIRLAVLRESLKARLADEDGAISIEYVGIVAFVAAIVLAILELGLEADISGFIQDKVSEILGG
jgi:Flp pilus assembly pilin Flp